jgi:hypothetical protein
MADFKQKQAGGPPEFNVDDDVTMWADSIEEGALLPGPAAGNAKNPVLTPVHDSIPSCSQSVDSNEWCRQTYPEKLPHPPDPDLDPPSLNEDPSLPTTPDIQIGPGKLSISASYPKEGWAQPDAPSPTDPMPTTTTPQQGKQPPHWWENWSPKTPDLTPPTLIKPTVTPEQQAANQKQLDEMYQHYYPNTTAVPSAPPPPSPLPPGDPPPAPATTPVMPPVY